MKGEEKDAVKPERGGEKKYSRGRGRTLKVTTRDSAQNVVDRQTPVSPNYLFARPQRARRKKKVGGGGHTKSRETRRPSAGNEPPQK